MRFPKLYYVLCATAICAGVLSAHADDNAAQAAARAAVLQKMQEINGATDTNTPAPAPAPAPVVTVPPIAAPIQPAAVAPVIIPAAPVAPVASTSDTADNAAQAAARAALIQKSVELDSQRIGVAPTPSAPTPTPGPVTVPPALVVTPTPVVSAPVEYHPIVGPALPISTDQQSQLQALDAKYYANQISPVDYFTQREAILKGQ